MFFNSLIISSSDLSAVAINKTFLPFSIAQFSTKELFPLLAPPDTKINFLTMDFLRLSEKILDYVKKFVNAKNTNKQIISDNCSTAPKQSPVYPSRCFLKYLDEKKYNNNNITTTNTNWGIK